MAVGIDGLAQQGDLLHAPGCQRLHLFGDLLDRAAHLPAAPVRWLVTGGGRRNPALMTALAERLEAPVQPVEAVGWDGDALEAQAFAYLALRSPAGLPLSLPETTGVARPMPGGVMHRAPDA